MKCFLTAFREAGRVVCHNQLLGTISQDNLCIEPSLIKWLFHLVPVSLLVKATIPGHDDEIVFATESHKKDQEILDKFLSWFGGFYEQVIVKRV